VDREFHISNRRLVRHVSKVYICAIQNTVKNANVECNQYNRELLEFYAQATHQLAPYFPFEVALPEVTSYFFNLLLPEAILLGTKTHQCTSFVIIAHTLRQGLEIKGWMKCNANSECLTMTFSTGVNDANVAALFSLRQCAIAISAPLRQLKQSLDEVYLSSIEPNLSFTDCDVTSISQKVMRIQNEPLQFQLPAILSPIDFVAAHIAVGKK